MPPSSCEMVSPPPARQRSVRAAPTPVRRTGPAGRAGRRTQRRGSSGGAADASLTQPSSCSSDRDRSAAQLGIDVVDCAALLDGIGGIGSSTFADRCREVPRCCCARARRLQQIELSASPAASIRAVDTRSRRIVGPCDSTARLVVQMRRRSSVRRVRSSRVDVRAHASTRSMSTSPSSNASR